MTHLYNRAAQKQPAMLEDARKREHDRRIGALALFDVPAEVQASAEIYSHEPPWEPPSSVE